MIASAVEMLAEAFAGAQTEIVVLMVAILAHRMLFTSTRVRAKPKKLASDLPAGTPSPASFLAPAPVAGRKVEALKAALASSDLEAALAAFGAGAASSPSAAPEALLHRLLRLALDRSQAPAALRELGRLKLLSARLVEGLLADPAVRGTAAGVAEVVGLAKAEGVEPTTSMYCTLLKCLGAEGRLEEARGVFEGCAERSTCVLNAFLDVCVTCNDARAAERVFAQARGDETADVTTYNTIIKAHLRNGELRRARAVMESMRGAGLLPNVVTFNELIDATLRTSPKDAWALIDEMRARGLQPSQVTCSILLKSIGRASKATDHDIERTLAVLDSVGESMDEVLLSSVCEACIRADRADLLRAQLQKRGGLGGVKVSGAHTFGSIIRAHGFVGDLEGIWARWREMRQRGIRPTSITMGCMVEALVTNAGPEAGHALIREVRGDKDLCDLVNAVIYNSVLKGYAQQKRHADVWAVYQEMLRDRLQFSIVTYNTIVDACAKCGEMDSIPGVMEEMSRQHIEPNVITYSTILKGYVQENQLEKAFQLLDEMKLTKDLRPDEIAYNTLLDGCARRALFDRGVALLRDMEDAGVKPSNFTLSVLVKLANRSRRLDQAFELCDRVSRKHCLRPNIHVFNNLMQACTAHKDHDRALQVLARAAEEGVRPDARTYGILLRGCAVAGDLTRVADLVRAAYGLRGGAVAAACCGEDAAALQVRGGLPFELLSEAFAGLRGQQEDVALELLRELRGLPSSRVDMKVLTRLATKIVR